MTNVVLFLIVMFLLITLCYLFNICRQPKRLRLVSSNWLSKAYDIFNEKIYPFKSKISEKEQEYIYSLIDSYEHKNEFNNGYEISPYSFSISIDKNTNQVNPTRFNMGSVEKDINHLVIKLLKHIQVNDTLCTTGFKYYGIGWDLLDGIIKIYTIKERDKIECFVYKVKRNERNEVTSSSFLTKKSYDIGKKSTIMYKNGKKVRQINTSRDGCIDLGNQIANAWVKNMQGLGYIFDTFSDYDGKINLYFD